MMPDIFSELSSIFLASLCLETDPNVNYSECCQCYCSHDVLTKRILDYNFSLYFYIKIIFVYFYIYIYAFGTHDYPKCLTVHFLLIYVFPNIFLVII